MFYLFESSKCFGIFEENKNDFELIFKIEFKTVEESIDFISDFNSKSSLPANLLNFLKSSKITEICVSNSEIQNKLKKETGIKANCDMDLYRKFKSHPKLIQSLNITESDINKMTLAVAHRLCSFKLEVSPDLIDNMVIQAVHILDDVDKDLNTTCMRLRDWYSCHFPELSEIVADNLKYAKAITIIGNKEQYIEEVESKKVSTADSSSEESESNKSSVADNSSEAESDTEKASEANRDNEVESKNSQATVGELKKEASETVNIKTQSLSDILKIEAIEEIYKMIKISTGGPIEENDLQKIKSNAESFVKQFTYKDELNQYLIERTRIIAPNMTQLLGSLVVSKMIAKAGSMSALAQMPASTIQILGSEKAFFTAVKARSNTPKYGYIFHCDIITNLDPEQKGTIARKLAAKASIACKIDYYRKREGILNNNFGREMKNKILEECKKEKNQKRKKIVKNKEKFVFNNKEKFSEKRKKIEK